MGSAEPRLPVGLVSPLPPQVGGVARVAGWLLENEEAIGCRYAPFDLRRPAGGEIGGRLRFASIRLQVALLLRYLRWLRSAPAIVHVAVSDSVTGLARDLVLVAAARLAGRRVVAHFHSLHYGAARGARVFHVPALRAIAALSAARVTLGPTAAAELERLGVSSRPIFNPLPAALAPPSGTAANGTLRLLCVGVYGAKKGTDVLVDGFARARREGVEATLTLVGRPAYTGDGERLRAQLERLGLDGAVELAGQRPPEEVPRFLARADAICLVSPQEGLPMALLEGMAAGLPALATAVGCVPDVVDGESGILVEAGDAGAVAAAIARLSADPERRRRMGEAARRRVYSLAAPERVAAEWRELYAAAAGERRLAAASS